jgi:hypothetical protein
MTDQEVFSAKCEARAAWLESLGFDPDTCTTDDLIRLVHSGASKPRDDGWAQLFGPGWQPPDPNFRYALPQEGLRLPSPRMNGVTATGNEGAGLIWQPPDPDARYDINTDE